jgi:SAM-dependent methyltransferase
MSVYENPLYYEIAFGFIDTEKQVDSFERIIKEFSKRRVKRFLDVCCGPSLQLREIAGRGYEAIGLDNSPEMLKYLKKRAREERVKIETVKADMTSFSLRRKADFAFIMMGSFSFESNESLLSHLDCVASSLNKGGLYFIQNMLLDWGMPVKKSWIMNRDNIEVRTDFELELKNTIKQTYAEKLVLNVLDRNGRRVLIEEKDRKLVLPQEFKTLIDLNRRFEFLGWWGGSSDTWHLDRPLEEIEEVEDNMVLLRRI